MWILSWRKYEGSKFATFISIVGALTRYGGAMCLFSGLIPEGLLTFAIGIGIQFLAEKLGNK